MNDYLTYQYVPGCRHTERLKIVKHDPNMNVIEEYDIRRDKDILDAEIKEWKEHILRYLRDIDCEYLYCNYLRIFHFENTPNGDFQFINSYKVVHLFCEPTNIYTREASVMEKVLHKENPGCESAGYFLCKYNDMW